ncbi:helix-turn-helix domain-containing protein [Streptomyces sp. NPDC002285]
MLSDGGATGRSGPSELAELLEDLKRRSGRSYAALAHRTGLSRSTIHRYCQGITVPGTFGVVERVARVSGASPAELDRLYRAWCRETAGDTGHQDEQLPESVEPAEPPTHAHPTEAGRNDAGSGGRGFGARLPSVARTWLRPAVLLLALVITSAGSTPTYDGGRGREVEGTPGPATVNTGGDGTGAGGEQRPEGPEWSEAPRPIAPEFIGMTINSDTGRMPGFRTGSVRLWNSETRWGTIETSPGRYDWTTLERLVKAAERERLPVLFTIAGTPWWAAPDGRKSGFADSTASPPDDLKVWDRFVEKLATRYRGRIESYELWDYPSHPLMYAGSLETLAEMVERASRIIRRIDPKARLACPSFGSLWTGKGRALLRKFARTGAYAHCDAAALKMPPRKGDGRPEEIIELSRSMRNLLHEENVHDIELWNTGPEWDINSTPPLDARHAGDYAVRFGALREALRRAADVLLQLGQHPCADHRPAGGRPPGRARKARRTTGGVAGRRPDQRLRAGHAHGPAAGHVLLPLPAGRAGRHTVHRALVRSGAGRSVTGPPGRAPPASHGRQHGARPPRRTDRHRRGTGADRAPRGVNPENVCAPGPFQEAGRTVTVLLAGWFRAQYLGFFFHLPNLQVSPLPAVSFWHTAMRMLWSL